VQARKIKNFRQWYQEIMPTGSGALFFIQIFSTLSFSVLYSTLVLYTTKALNMSDMLATSITASFIALNFFLHLLGGYIGGRFLSNRSLFAIGMFLQIIGCLLISIPTSSFLLWGLSAFLAGSGLNVVCINCLVTQLFEPEDKRRESAFLWNYSGMNIGFLIGFTVSGYFHLHHAYQQLFLLSALGNVLALIITIANWKILNDRDTTLLTKPLVEKRKLQWLGFGITIVLVFILRALLNQPYFCNQLVLVLGAVILALITALAIKQPDQIARNKMWAYLILALAALIFWTLYQLAPMGLIIFIERNVDRHVMGMTIAPQWVQNINTLVIIIGGPLFSIIFTRLRERGLNLNIPLQFSLGLLLIGIAFAILPVAIRMANPQGLVSFYWIVLSYLLQSIGELFISPIGYAMVGQLAPPKLRGLMMGMWLMMTGIAVILSDQFSKMALGNTESINPLITNPSFSHTFNVLGWSAIAGGVFLFVFVPRIAGLTRERKMAEGELVAAYHSS